MVSGCVRTLCDLFFVGVATSNPSNHAVFLSYPASTNNLQVKEFLWVISP